jgi:hypothetical protein
MKKTDVRNILDDLLSQKLIKGYNDELISVNFFEGESLSTSYRYTKRMIYFFYFLKRFDKVHFYINEKTDEFLIYYERRILKSLDNHNTILRRRLIPKECLTFKKVEVDTTLFQNSHFRFCQILHNYCRNNQYEEMSEYLSEDYSFCMINVDFKEEDELELKGIIKKELRRLIKPSNYYSHEETEIFLKKKFNNDYFAHFKDLFTRHLRKKKIASILK